MSDHKWPVFSLDHDSAGSGISLFRQGARQANHRQVLGAPSIMLPPSSATVAFFAAMVVALLVTGSFLIEVPRLIRGIGVIMPGDGFLPISAGASGRVREVLVSEKQAVRKGDVLLRLSGDAIASGDKSIARLELQSFENELLLRGRDIEQSQVASMRRMKLLESRQASLDRRVSVLVQERRLHEDNLLIAKRRVDRSSKLQSAGGDSPEHLDSATVIFLQAEIALRELLSRIEQMKSEKHELSAERELAVSASDLRQLNFAVTTEKLQRQIRNARLKISREIVAPRDAMVSRIRIAPGETVQPGQALILLQTGSAELEAWLYVPTRSGGTVSVGQALEIRIDAFPHQVFGTQAATVESVSAIALRPSELRIPLDIREPVFEVRARLNSQVIGDDSNDWELVPGLSFQADVVQSRYPLYKWLLRHLLSASQDTSA